MKINKKGKIEFEEGEPVFRSCWNCNGSHKHLKNTNYLILCFSCGKYYLKGRWLGEFKTDKGLKDYIKKISEKIK